jgi:hypothetical protein
MHDLLIRTRTRALSASGYGPSHIATALGLPLGTVNRWLHARSPTDVDPPQSCFVCRDTDPDAAMGAAYCYLLGQYLGDGHLVTKARVPVLRIYACDDYPAIIVETGAAIRAVRGTPPGRLIAPAKHLVTVQSYWMHWPCLFPQHGPGPKHKRPIELAPWQRDPSARNHGRSCAA